MFYVLEPEVAGHFGKNSVVDTSVRPPSVTKFHYELDGWLGDDLLETISSFVVTDRLRSVIEQSASTGYEFAPVEVTTSEQFDELYPDRELPNFWWLKIIGKPGVDDLGLSSDHRLVVRDGVFAKIQQRCQLDNCEVTEFPPPSP